MPGVEVSTERRLPDEDLTDGFAMISTPSNRPT